MKKVNLMLAVTSIVLMMAAAGCRTKPKKTVNAPTPPETGLSAPPITAVENPPDFVKEPGASTTPVVTREELTENIDELNRTAAGKGWIQDAFFDYDAAQLSPQAQEALSTSANWLKAHPEYRLLIEGHCDERGTEQYNLALGDRRSNQAKEYLSTLGVDASRMKTVSYGEERPFAQGTTEDAFRQNRRAHLVITGK
ncbi:MAG TPA: peptidoglycan-associated lipoprotein Pal [Thermoanaerobaculia bacterium]|nr:peptidoglycan-associated lipoprotein Pal [Thermoanaerobaculia bacterium]